MTSLHCPEKLLKGDLPGKVPLTLARFEILGAIGRGSGSSVFKIRSRGDGLIYAMKVINRKVIDKSTLQARYRRELEIHSSLDHPNIVKLHASFEDEDNLYLIMEYCEGGELYKYLQQKTSLNEQEAAYISFEIAKGICYFHKMNIVHRDLKLGNILLTKDYVPKICDFGLALKLTDNEGDEMGICGTPNYLAPEVLDKKGYSLKSDCWAFGCILYSLIQGQPPFEAPSVQETLTKIRNMNFRLPKGVTLNLSILLEGLLTQNVKKRYSMEDVLDSLFYHGLSKMSETTHKPKRRMEYTNTEKRIASRSEVFNNENMSPNIFDFTLQKTAKKMPESKPKVSPLFSHHDRASSVGPLLVSRSEFSDVRLTPIVLSDLEPMALVTKRGFVEVTEDLSLKLEFFEGKICLEITPDGTRVDIIKNGAKPLRKSYTLLTLPSKFVPLYQYAVEITQTIRSKTALVRISDDKGTYLLMKNTPKNCFEARFTNGYTVHVTVDSTVARIVSPEGTTYEFDSHRELEHLSSAQRNMVAKAYEMLNQCLTLKMGSATSV
eukprot:TRINITY_DN2774_c0_g1_i12.p1 TRINITY_DN2774_c0_g1~~TRINITY_DN2774_c0_g1_i12.p1  ORF type:complete len:549 (+),score=73.44 TRINITY_DN2774_c0_g1_i12:1025-2671(+)